MQVTKRQLGLLYSPPGSSGGKEPISKSQNSLHADKLNDTALTSPALWVDAIKTARQLLKITESVANAIAILKAMDS